MCQSCKAVNTTVAFVPAGSERTTRTRSCGMCMIIRLLYFLTLYELKSKTHFNLCSKSLTLFFFKCLFVHSNVIWSRKSGTTVVSII